MINIGRYSIINQRRAAPIRYTQYLQGYLLCKADRSIGHDVTVNSYGVRIISKISSPLGKFNAASCWNNKSEN